MAFGIPAWLVFARRLWYLILHTRLEWSASERLSRRFILDAGSAANAAAGAEIRIPDAPAMAFFDGGSAGNTATRLIIRIIASLLLLFLIGIIGIGARVVLICATAGEEPEYQRKYYNGCGKGTN